MDTQRKMVFTTKMVDEIIELMNDGVIPKRHESPWFKNEVGVRRAGVSFRMSPLEQQEYIKCALDVYYFAEKYCKIKTEDGSINNINFDGRDYQREMLSNFVNFRYNILMAARQSGKCSGFNTLILIKISDDVEIVTRIGKLYYDMLSLERKLTILEKIKIKLYDLLYLMKESHENLIKK